MEQKRVIVDLVTGFLGAGKTTFIHRYLHYLRQKGLSVRIIENEFGNVGIDSLLLQKDDCDIMDLSGLCMCCVGKQQFIQMLQSSAALGCDRILVEPSGIYDVDEFFEVMTLPQIHDVCETGSIITIVDPLNINRLTSEAKYLLFTQLLASGSVVFSRTQCMSNREIEAACAELNDLMRERGCSGGVLADVFTKDWNAFADGDFETIEENGYYRIVHEKESFVHAEVFQAINAKGSFRDREDLCRCIRDIFAAEDCGTVFRVKGFISDETGTVYEVNCTKDITSIKEAESADTSLTIIGQKIKPKGFRRLGLHCSYT